MEVARLANEQNLRPPFTPKQAREYGRKGGIASQAARRKKKTIAETVSGLLNEPIKDKSQLNVIKSSGMPIPAKPTYKDFLVASVIMKSIKRGTVDDLSKLMAIIGETAGGVPVDAVRDDALSKSLKELGKELESDD